MKGDNKYISKSIFFQKLFKDLNNDILLSKVASEFGGSKHYVPKKYIKDHKFSKFGDKFFNWLIDNYGGESIVIPLATKNIERERKKKILHLIQSGYTNNEISKILNVHYSTVVKERVKSKDESPK